MQRNFVANHLNHGRQWRVQRLCKPEVHNFSRAVRRHDGQDYTHAIIVGGEADRVGGSIGSSGIARFFLFLASIFTIVRLVEFRDNGVVLQLPITRCVRGKIDVCFILQKRIVPTTNVGKY